MRRMRAGVGLLTFTIVAIVVAIARIDSPEGTAEAQPRPAAAPITMPGQLGGFLLTVGLKDAEAKDWDGTVTVSAGKVLSVDFAEANPKANVSGSRFQAKSVFAKPKAKKKDTVIRPIVRVTLDAPPSARVQVKTNHGAFDFVLADLPTDTARFFLDGQASAVREDGALRLTGEGAEHDYPAVAAAPDGTVWLASCEYHTGTPFVLERVLAGDFDALVPEGNGDTIRLRHFDGKTWSQPLKVTGMGLDIWRPCVTVAPGCVHVSWSQQVSGNWDIYHRAYFPGRAGSPGRWSEIVRVSSGPGSDFNVVSTTAGGKVWLAWQSWDNGRFRIRARVLDAKASKVVLVGAEIPVTTADANNWSPAIAADQAGKVYIAYDTYAKDNYDIVAAELAPEGVVRTHAIAASARAEMRPSIVCDRQNRLWVAYEEGDEQWGKDFSTNMFRKIGFNENPGSALYVQRTVRVKCLDGGAVKETGGDLQQALVARTAANKSMSRIGIDGTGAPWLFYRHHPKPLGTGEVWNSFATRYDGAAWSTPRRLAHSDNLMDNRPAVAPMGQGILAVHSADSRTKQQDRKRNDLFASVLFGSGPPQPTALIPPAPIVTQMKAVHPNETADVARIRAYRFEHEGKKLHLFRGEFHRHTEYTAHRDQDGLLEDSWRYALDAGNLDWMGNADHDNGHHDEYSWWQIQKTADLMHNAPTFVAVQSYERSNKYPDGHRNVILPKRGIRPLPRGSLVGTEEAGTPDTKILFKYLKHFDGMCSSHTSGTSMGTDWRDNDPVYEPVVEVYQGHRHNYEHFGAPRSATELTHIGGYEPKGFIWNAFAKGYKLGFQASSDHVSTHMSYGVVLTDDLSRKGIIDAFKRRHSYAATDNIIVEFRSGPHVMGDIFETKAAPTFSIKVLGTAPVTKVSIVRDAKYIHVEQPKTKDVSFTFTDPAPVAGTSYYYVRVEQSDANLAWASPMWITYKGK